MVYIFYLNSTVILLIWQIERYISKSVDRFKFHCDSINIVAVATKSSRQEEFKFHCDSINIELLLTMPEEEYNLNSTVILLIFVLLFLIFLRNLFKFHCDSINIHIQKNKS